MDEKVKDKSVGSNVSMIGPLAALLAAIITAFANLPTTFQYVMVLLIAVIASVSVYVVFGQQIRRFFKKSTMKIKHHFLVNKHFSEFNRFVDRLEKLLKNNYCDSMTYVFVHLQNMPPEFNYPRSLIHDLADLVAFLKEAMKKFHRKDFRLIIKLFDLILRVYNNQLVIQPFGQIRNLYRNKLTERDMEAYAESRESYVCFLRDYENFAEAINKDWGKGIARDYFDKPGILQKA